MFTMSYYSTLVGGFLLFRLAVNKHEHRHMVLFFLGDPRGLAPNYHNDAQCWAKGHEL